MTEQVCPIPHRQDPLRHRRAAPGLLVCAGCADRIGRTVGELPRLHADLEHVLAGTWRDRAGDDTWPLAIAENPLPLQPAVAECREAIRQRLVSWSVMVAEERGEHAPGSTLAAVARWLVDRHDWVLAQLWVDDYVAEMNEVFGQARRLLDTTRRAWVFLGPCLVETPGNGTCQVDVYAVEGADTTTCKGCGIEHEVQERRDWLLDQMHDHLATVEEAADFASKYHQVTVSPETVKTWAKRRQIDRYGTQPKDPGQPGEPRGLYRVRDVVLRAGQMAATRRATA